MSGFFVFLLHLVLSVFINAITLAASCIDLFVIVTQTLIFTLMAGIQDLFFAFFSLLQFFWMTGMNLLWTFLGAPLIWIIKTWFHLMTWFSKTGLTPCDKVRFLDILKTGQDIIRGFLPKPETAKKKIWEAISKKAKSFIRKKDKS